MQRYLSRAEQASRRSWPASTGTGPIPGFSMSIYTHLADQTGHDIIQLFGNLDDGDNTGNEPYGFHAGAGERMKFENKLHCRAPFNYIHGITTRASCW